MNREEVVAFAKEIIINTYENSSEHKLAQSFLSECAKNDELINALYKCDEMYCDDKARTKFIFDTLAKYREEK